MNSGTSIFLNDVAGAWSSWMLGMAWIVAVLVVVLSLITTILKGRSASLLYTLWLLVLVRLVLPPDFALPTGWGWWFRDASASASPAAVPAVPTRDPSVSAAGDAMGTPNNDPPELPSSPSVPFALILMIAWLGIVAARCGMLLTAALQVHVWVSRAHLILDPSLLELLDECRNRVGVRRLVELRNSEACSTPLVVGVWRPVLLLPSAVLDRLSTEQLRSVLIHELHHVRRWDGMVNLLQGLLGAVYFFHPAVWWANRRIRQLREDACDECTVAVLEGNRKPYGEAIFRVAEILGYSAPPLTLGVLDSTSPLTQRLRRILDPHLPVEGVRRWQTALVLIVTMAVLLPAGARPSASVADARSDRRIVAETFSDSPLGPLKKERVPQTLREVTPEEELPPQESITPKAPEAVDDLTSDQTSIQELVNDLAVRSRRAAAVTSLVALGTNAEPALLATLPTSERETRSAIYEVLVSIGTEQSVLALQQALLVRGGPEQRQIERALDAVYGRMEIPVSRMEPSVNSSRVFQNSNRSGDW